MKDYGRNDRLKSEKKKKRKFEVIMNTATHGIYSDFTPMKVAKKVTSDLVGKKKHIIFRLREMGKSGKTYGAYIGSIRDGKVVVRSHKMRGGEMGCVFNKITPNNFKVDKSVLNNPPLIAITKFCVKRTTIIFFCINQQSFLEKDNNKYYTYAIYRDGKEVLLKELENNNNELVAKTIKFENIPDKSIFNKIKTEIENKRNTDKKEIAKDILAKIKSFTSNSQPQQQPQQPQSQSQQQQAQQQPQAQQPQQQQQQVRNNIIRQYICPNPPDKDIQEIKETELKEIFFGFDIDLLIDVQKKKELYYKYSYHDEEFYELVKDKDGNLNEKQIDIESIPLYYRLCLYEFAKGKVKNQNGSNNNFYIKLLEKIRPLLNNKNKTISLSKHTLFPPLGEKNFNKKQERAKTNIGKIKKTPGKKTYYFFGKNDDDENKYKFACYKENVDGQDIISCYKFGDSETIYNISMLDDRLALEDLKSFIILRRIKNPKDSEFGKEIYLKASKRINELKKIKITESYKKPVKPAQNSKNSSATHLPHLPHLSSALPVSPPPPK
jgi:hypothetical protein